jgi:hypothetical protein
MRMLYLDPPGKAGHDGRQVNAGLTWEMPAGRAPLEVRVGDKVAGEVVLEIRH